MGCRPSSPEVPVDAPPDPPPREIPEVPSKRGSYRPSIVSLQIPNKDYIDDVSSDGMSDRSVEGENHSDRDFLCGTDVTLQWLLQRLSDRLEKVVPEEPQWITERLNKPSWDDYATSAVIRVTFGWDDDDLPRSLVLKVPVAKEHREDEEGKFHYLMFKRECNVYEWTQKYPKLASPRIFHIKRHSKESGGSGVVVMEDVAEKGGQQDAAKGLSVGAVRDLLNHLAYLHAQAMKHTSWSTLIADLPPSYYSHIISDFDKTMDFFEHQDVDHSRFTYTAKYFTRDFLHSTATEAAEDLGVPRTLVHGEPYAPNVFVQSERDEEKVIGVIDWTECHSGCFGEDVAKAICWNLSIKDRMECAGSLLEGYHYHLMKYSNQECSITFDVVRKAYERFVPFAMVTLVAKTMSVRDRDDVEPLIDRAKGLIENVYATAQLMMMQNEESSGNALAP